MNCAISVKEVREWLGRVYRGGEREEDQRCCFVLVPMRGAGEMNPKDASSGLRHMKPEKSGRHVTGTLKVFRNRKECP